MGLADPKLRPFIDITLWHKNLKYLSVSFPCIDHNDSLSLICILYTSVITYTHFSLFTHIYHLAWEFKWTIYNLFQYALLHSTKDKWTVIIDNMWLWVKTLSQVHCDKWALVGRHLVGTSIEGCVQYFPKGTVTWMKFLLEGGDCLSSYFSSNLITCTL